MKMDKGSLRAVLDSERTAALSAASASKLTIERTKAMDYYLGDMANDMPAPDGTSSAISTDVFGKSAKTSASPIHFLTGPNAGNPIDIALAYIKANAAQLGLTAADISGMAVTD